MMSGISNIFDELESEIDALLPEEE
jgi:hypothetical protein